MRDGCGTRDPFGSGAVPGLDGVRDGVRRVAMGYILPSFDSAHMSFTVVLSGQGVALSFAAISIKLVVRSARGWRSRSGVAGSTSRPARSNQTITISANSFAWALWAPL